MVRRCTLLYMAMFVLEQQWLQVILFMFMNVGAVSFLASTMPYTDSKLNYISIYNEVLVLILSYFIM